MFKMIGSDGMEYGPVPTETLREWIRQGRANAETSVREDGANEWLPVANIPELAGSVPTAAVAEPAPTAAKPAAVVRVAEPAGRGQRLLAVIIDAACGAACSLPGLYPDPAIGIFLMLGLGLMLLAFQIFLLSTTGQTIGKRLIGVRIVRFDDGGNPGFVHAVLLRLGVMMLMSAVAIVSLIDVLMIFREDRRCLHDLIAGTEVVKA